MLIIRLNIFSVLAVILLSTAANSLTKEETKEKIIGEIISTEKSYNEGLKKFKTYFLDPIASKISLKLNKNVRTLVKKIKSHIIPITDLSNQVLAKLNSNKTSTGVAVTFITFASDFKLLGPYQADFFDVSKQMAANDFKNNKDVKKIEDALGKQPGGLGSGAFLITPIQRITKYGLLLNELLKVEPGNNLLKQALEKIEAVAKYINDFGRPS